MTDAILETAKQLAATVLCETRPELAIRLARKLQRLLKEQATT